MHKEQRQRRAAAAKVAAVPLLMLLVIQSASADASSSYEDRAWATFHRLFDRRNFRPSCLDKNRQCQGLLGQIARNDFQFIPPIEYGSPKLSKLSAMRKRCPNIGRVYIQFDGIPLHPTSGFALYAIPPQLSPHKSQSIYLLRSEDYRDDGRFTVDGTFSVFSDTSCKTLKKILYRKSRKSRTTPNAPNQDISSLAEPIVIGGRVLILILYAENENAANEPPFYAMTLWGITSDGRAGDELYSFSGR